uniref:Uncharacterized protein n=1 Tax=Salix viminalis TaxID=40686 RepID=A0A6N2LU63_SALVM
MRHVSHLDTAISTAKAAATSPSPSPPAVVQPRSPWHSPVPYSLERDLESGNEKEGKPENKVLKRSFCKASSFVARLATKKKKKRQRVHCGHDDKVKNQEMIGDSHDQAATTGETQREQETNKFKNRISLHMSRNKPDFGVEND